MKKLFVLLSILLLMAAPTLGQSIQTDQNVKGDVICYAMDPPDNYYAGTTAGIFRSSDKGKSWSAVGQQVVIQPVRVIQLQGSKIFAGTDSGGIFLSTNAGQNWDAVNNGLQNKHVLSIGIRDALILVGTTNGGVFLWDNTAGIWKLVNDGLPPDANVYTLSVEGTTLYAGTQRGVYTSAVENIKWSPVRV